MGVDLVSLVAQGRIDEIRELIEEEVCDVDQRNDRGETVLMEAAYHGHLELVKYLLSKGAYVNTQCKDFGNSPLIWACNKSRLSVVEYLLDETECDINLQSTNGESALFEALRCYDEDIVILLIARGADVAIKTLDQVTLPRLKAQISRSGDGGASFPFQQCIWEGLQEREEYIAECKVAFFMVWLVCIYFTVHSSQFHMQCVNSSLDPLIVDPARVCSIVHFKSVYV